LGAGDPLPTLLPLQHAIVCWCSAKLSGRISLTAPHSPPVFSCLTPVCVCRLQNNKLWGKFFRQIDWTQGENNAYRKWPAEFKYSPDAPKGHLPLTNALRGTQLFQAILEHPAFEKKLSKGIDERAQEAGGSALKL